MVFVDGKGRKSTRLHLLLPTLGLRWKTCWHECQHGTQECVRHGGASEALNPDWIYWTVVLPAAMTSDPESLEKFVNSIVMFTGPKMRVSTLLSSRFSTATPSFTS